MDNCVIKGVLENNFMGVGGDPKKGVNLEVG